jgi:hypothetical protein
MDHPHCHQRRIRDSLEAQDRIEHPELFDRPIQDYLLAHERHSADIGHHISKYEWIGTVGTFPRWCFTARLDGVIGGAVLLNLPNAFSKLLGDGTKPMECLIQRGASASFGHPHLASKLIMWSIRWMVANTDKRIFYGYSDERAGERGIIYSACNFQCLGGGFGAAAMYRHHTWSAGKEFCAHSLRRTGVLKKWMKERGMPWLPEYALPNGFKNLATLPVSIKEAWYRWGDAIVKESEKIKIPTKVKWVMVLGRDRRETKQLRARMKL